jgi:hypothetical protein
MHAPLRWFAAVVSMALLLSAPSCANQPSPPTAPASPSTAPTATAATAPVPTPPAAEATATAAPEQPNKEWTISSRAVFVVDRSGRMTDSLDFVKPVLKKVIAGFEDYVTFQVIFFSAGPPIEMPPGNLVPATEANKKIAFKFIDGITAQGETDPSKALEQAFALKTDVIYLLTSGDFGEETVGLVKRLNPRGYVVVHTACFRCKDPNLNAANSNLGRIATENGGQCKFFPDMDLEELKD